MMSEFSSEAQAASWMFAFAALTSGSRRLATCVTTLLTIVSPATSRSIAFALSISGFDSHFRNSHEASLFFEYELIENGIEIA